MCFLKADESQVRQLKDILSIFEIIFRLKINLSKTALAKIKVIEEDINHFARILGCKIGE